MSRLRFEFGRDAGRLRRAGAPSRHDGGGGAPYFIFFLMGLLDEPSRSRTPPRASAERSVRRARSRSEGRTNVARVGGARRHSAAGVYGVVADPRAPCG